MKHQAVFTKNIFQHAINLVYRIYSDPLNIFISFLCVGSYLLKFSYNPDKYPSVAPSSK